MMEFKVIFLAAGYGTRLVKDLEETQLRKWQDLRSCPKPLIELNKVPLISRWMDILSTEGDRVSAICVITNDKFYDQFEKWKEGLVGRLKEKVVIFNDFSSSNEDRLGAVTDLHQAMTVTSQEGECPVLVIAGDTIFSAEFSLHQFINRFGKLQEAVKGSSLIVGAPCSEENVAKHGIVDVDEKGKVISFLEKPSPTETQSRRQSPCFYLLSSEAAGRVKEFLEIHRNDKRKIDSTGSFIQYLVPSSPVYVFDVAQRFDLGNLASCIEADEYFENHES